MEATQAWQRMPLEGRHSNEELIGKYVRIISDASDRHYRKFGRIVGFGGGSGVDGQVTVYISDTRSCVSFGRSSLELLN